MRSCRFPDAGRELRDDLRHMAVVAVRTRCAGLMVRVLVHVVTQEVTYWAPCAWDALSIPAILGLDSVTESLCPDCGERLTLTVRDAIPSSDAEVVHFTVAARNFWDNIGFT